MRQVANGLHKLTIPKEEQGDIHSRLMLIKLGRMQDMIWPSGLWKESYKYCERYVGMPGNDLAFWDVFQLTRGQAWSIVPVESRP